MAISARNPAQSGRAMRLQRLCRMSPKAQDRPREESAGQSLRQRQGRELHHDAARRGDRRQHRRRSRRRVPPDHPLSQKWRLALNLGGRSSDFCVGVASAWGEARRRSEPAALEDGLERAREDRAPFLRLGQLLRIFGEPAQEPGDRGEGSFGRSGLGVRTRHADCGLARMARARSDGRQEQRPAGDGLAMAVGLSSTKSQPHFADSPSVRL